MRTEQRIDDHWKIIAAEDYARVGKVLEAATAVVKECGPHQGPSNGAVDRLRDALEQLTW